MAHGYLCIHCGHPESSHYDPFLKFLNRPKTQSLHYRYSIGVCPGFDDGLNEGKLDKQKSKSPA